MIIRKCQGCGIELQYEDSKKEGYVPEEKFISEGELFCQRCFKIKNYGQNMVNTFKKEDYLKEVSKSLKKADIVLPIFDIIDFEGSFSEEILDYLRDFRSLILVNKMDLLPDFTHPSEISEWIKRRLAEEDIVSDDIAFISAKNKYGINGIIRKINSIFPGKKTKAVILGASNTGKSSVINLLLGKNKITTSKYSGTTLKSISNRIPKTDITVIDTPGLIPEGRITDFLSPETGLKLVPSGEISRKTFKLNKNKIFMLDSLCRFKILDSEETNNENKESKIHNSSFSVYSSKSVKFHIAKEERVEELLRGDFFNILEGEEKDKFFKREFITHIVKVNKNEDVAIAGLGWINVKRGPLTMELVLPKGVKAVVRPSLFQKKKIDR